MEFLQVSSLWLPNNVLGEKKKKKKKKKEEEQHTIDLPYMSTGTWHMLIVISRRDIFSI